MCLTFGWITEYFMFLTFHTSLLVVTPTEFGLDVDDYLIGECL